MQERNTVQKDIVYAALHALGNHPTADMVYARVQQDYPSISRATVYRVLGHMAEQGKILRINTDGADRYDHLVHPHCHVQCTRCGRMDDLSISDLGDLMGVVDDCCGYMLSGVSVIYQGLCRECQELCKEK